MSDMSSENSAEKIADRISGLLEKITDLRMLVLATTFFLYLDIWLIHARIDILGVSLSDAINSIRHIKLINLVFFAAFYSLIMAATLPGIRVAYSSVAAAYFSKRVDVRTNRSDKEKQLSTWSLGLIVFSVVDAVRGYLVPKGQYEGIVNTICSEAIADGFSATVLRVTVVFLILYCLALALQVDS